MKIARSGSAPFLENPTAVAESGNQPLPCVQDGTATRSAGFGKNGDSFALADGQTTCLILATEVDFDSEGRVDLSAPTVQVSALTATKSAAYGFADELAKVSTPVVLNTIEGSGPGFKGSNKLELNAHVQDIQFGAGTEGDATIVQLQVFTFKDTRTWAGKVSPTSTISYDTTTGLAR